MRAEEHGPGEAPEPEPALAEGRPPATDDNWAKVGLATGRIDWSGEGQQSPFFWAKFLTQEQADRTEQNGMTKPAPLPLFKWAPNP